MGWKNCLSDCVGEIFFFRTMGFRARTLGLAFLRFPLVAEARFWYLSGSVFSHLDPRGVIHLTQKAGVRIKGVKGFSTWYVSITCCLYH